jgi:hypothetical protein
MSRHSLFTKALKRAENLEKRYPSVETIRSIIRQLEYLIALDRGDTHDRSRLKNIIIGVQAAREIEPLDMTLADTLYRVHDEAQRM